MEYFYGFFGSDLNEKKEKKETTFLKFRLLSFSWERKFTIIIIITEGLTLTITRALRWIEHRSKLIVRHATCNPWHVSRGQKLLQPSNLRPYASFPLPQKKKKRNPLEQLVRSSIRSLLIIQTAICPVTEIRKRLESDANSAPPCSPLSNFEFTLLDPSNLLLLYIPLYTTSTINIDRLDLDFPGTERGRRKSWCRAHWICAWNPRAEVDRGEVDRRGRKGRRKRWKRHPCSDIWLAKLPAGWR